MWLLARPTGAANLQLLNLATGKITQVVPVVGRCGGGGPVAVGPASASASARARPGLSSSATAPRASSWPPCPSAHRSTSVFAGADGTTFYVLNGTSTSSSVTLVNSQTDKATVSVPVPLDTSEPSPSIRRARTCSPSDRAGPWTRSPSAAAWWRAASRSGRTPVQLGDLDVREHPLRAEVDARRGRPSAWSTCRPSARPRRCRRRRTASGVQPSIDGRSLYLIVGTQDLGNIQVFPLAS